MNPSTGTLREQPNAGVRDRLLDRRARLASMTELQFRPDYRELLDRVDSALARLESGAWGLCERCHEPIEQRRLAGDPLIRVCLDCLSEAQQRALERDLELAAIAQRALLPASRIATLGWEIEHRYLPLGPVSGDYCDVVRAGSHETATTRKA